MNECISKNAHACMSEEEFLQVMAAISEGKYSLACTLLLKFKGYDPDVYLSHYTRLRLNEDYQQSL